MSWLCVVALCMIRNMAAYAAGWFCCSADLLDYLVSAGCQFELLCCCCVCAIFVIFGLHCEFCRLFKMTSFSFVCCLARALHFCSNGIWMLMLRIVSVLHWIGFVFFLFPLSSPSTFSCLFAEVILYLHFRDGNMTVVLDKDSKNYFLYWLQKERQSHWHFLTLTLRVREMFKLKSVYLCDRFIYCSSIS